MKRREFLAIIGGVAAIPFAARAQQPAGAPTIGMLSVVAPQPAWVVAFKSGLGESGYVDGRNVKLEFSLAEGRYDRIPALAAELVRRKADVIVTAGGPVPAQAAKAATKTIPIVFVSGSDPVAFGVVDSLNRPGGNVTGVAFFNAALAGKRLELLRELVPAATVVAYLVNTGNSESAPETRDIQQAARVLGIALHVLHVRSAHDVDQAFAGLGRLRANAVIMASDPLLGSLRAQVAALAARHAMPTMSTAREYAALGGLVTYGTSFQDTYRQAGIYTGRILKGEKPGDLPVMQPTKFELVINLKAAKALRLEIPHKLLALADEVIE